MPFIPHTPDEIEQMLSAIGVANIDGLFREIPTALQIPAVNLPDGLSEAAISRLMTARARTDAPLINFAGAGAYDHHIPAAVWQIATRGEFYTAYTPYQAEASQGSLQLLYEYQSMMCNLLAMDCSNASLYDGATACVEAVLLAVRAFPESPKAVVVPQNLSPRYREVLGNVLPLQGIAILEVDFDEQSGCLDPDSLSAFAGRAVAVLIPQPNYFGLIEEVAALSSSAKSAGLAVIAVVNPLAMTLLKPPGEWGADIAVGDGQPLGIPLSSGGPYYGFMACTQALVRQMPGRIIGQTTDLEGKLGYTLTLQTREQHIRRAKATSNICTNQGLMVTASTIHMAIMGGAGLYAQAAQSHDHLQLLIALIKDANLPITARFSGATFHETVLNLPAGVSAQKLVEAGIERGILIGVPLSFDYPQWQESLLVCATEQRSAEELQRWVDTLADLLARPH